MIQVFNYQLNGSDAERFCAKSATEKFAWIQKRVKDVTEQQINEFLSRDLKHSKAGCGCSPETPKTNATSKPERVPEAVADVVESEPVAENSVGGNNEAVGSDTDDKGKRAKARRKS